MRTVILCGGQGTRAWPATAEIPKPMLHIGRRPALFHVMAIYAAQGFTDFVLATGYKGEVIRAWAQDLDTGWRVTCVDTGEEAETGERLRAAAAYAGERFFATYGDGLGDVDLAAVLRTHRDCHADATITTVPLPSPYGTIEVDRAGRVTAFREKPLLQDHWINAGFMVFETEAVLATPGASLERDVLPAIGAAGGLYAYRHTGFWKSMDTHKDVLELNRLAHHEGHPWLPTTR